MAAASSSSSGTQEAQRPLILVGTHHKTGTIWMGTLFRNLSNRLGREFHNGTVANVPATADVFLQNSSSFHDAYLDGLRKSGRPWRGIHIIRDPRDVIVSGCFYHQKSEEKWLHRPDPAFGGKTYQEAINALPTVEERLKFEMENRGAMTLMNMLEWDYTQPEFLEIKYERLVVDEELSEFRRIFEHLGLEGRDLKIALDVAHNNSLFGGMKAKKGSKLHLRSGDAEQWRSLYTPALVAHFKEIFPGALEKLGYEEDNSWTT